MPFDTIYKNKIGEQFTEIKARLEFEKHQNDENKKQSDARRAVFGRDYDDELAELDAEFESQLSEISQRYKSTRVHAASVTRESEEKAGAVQIRAEF